MCGLFLNFKVPLKDVYNNENVQNAWYYRFVFKTHANIKIQIIIKDKLNFSIDKSSKTSALHKNNKNKGTRNVNLCTNFTKKKKKVEREDCFNRDSLKSLMIEVGTTKQ